MRYAVRTALSQTLLTTSLRAGERHGISIDDLETGTQVMKLRSESAKTARLEVEQRLGAGSDRIRVTLDHVPLDANGELHINARPGLGGLDLLASQAADVEITIETDVGGQPSVHRYGANLAGGVRLRPSTIFTDGSLQVGRIDNVFGPIRDVSRLRPR